MAKIQFSAVVGDARNKIGGVVFTKARAGAMVRRKVSPIQPRSSTQRTVRANFTGLSKGWSALTDAQRAAWNALASLNPRRDQFGQSYTLTGLQLYQSINRTLQEIGEATIAAPPADLSAGYPGALTIVATAAAGGTLTVDYTTDPAITEAALIFAAAQVTAGRSFIGNRYRIVSVINPGAAGPADIKAAYVAKFGALIAGRKVPILVKYATIATGAVGTPSAALQVVS